MAVTRKQPNKTSGVKALVVSAPAVVRSGPPRFLSLSFYLFTPITQGRLLAPTTEEIPGFQNAELSLTNRLGRRQEGESDNQ